MTFRDGFVWDTREFLRSVPIENDQLMIQYVSQQTGIRIDSTQRIEQVKD